ncbi:MAG: 50S ribosomal protein L4 [candidate division WS1 bacterium]|jgi:large subunit ribosomal protein L4|nr:50S ribosomal protein L4 [candidate division WS1 bacterium]
MPQAAVLNLQGEEVKQIELDSTLFDVEPNLDLIHQALLYVDNQRAQPRGLTLSRSQVATTGAKMYRQKGLGRARHGDRGAPVFVGGARAHAPKGVRSRQRMPKKMRRKAVAGALTAQFRKGLLRFVEDFRPDEVSTRKMGEVLENLRCSRGKVLALVGQEEYYDDTLDQSCRNLPRFVLRCAPHVNVRDLLGADHIIVSQGALALMASGGEGDA